SYPLYEDLQKKAEPLAEVLCRRMVPASVSVDNQTERVEAELVSGNYFSVLGVPPMLGRVFDATIDRNVGGSPFAVISYGYWVRRFKSDATVLGKEIVIQNVRFTIVGVTPPSFTGDVVGAAPDVWLPITMQGAMYPNLRLLDNRGANWLLLLGRLEPGATIDRARQDVVTLMKQYIVANAPAATGQSFLAQEQKYFVSSGAKGFSRVRQTFAAPLLTLMMGVGLLLCIICANVANLLLARSIARGREMAVRLALGADRSRLVRQLLTESVLLATLGALCGLLVAWWGSRGLLALTADGAVVPLDIGMDGWVLAFTLGISFFAVVLFGLVPALCASRVDLASTMRAAAHSVAGSALGHRGQRAPLGKLLIAGQVALSVVLLVGAGMLVRSLLNLQSVDVGLDRDHLVIVDLDINARGYSGPRLASLVHTLRDRIGAIPGVAAVSYSENGIFSGTESSTSVQVPGFTARTQSDSSVRYDQVGPAYAHAIGGRVVEGRDLTDADESVPIRSVLVTQSLARF
ncbi:MAG: ABC transporter permease, partial [bacterium]